LFVAITCLSLDSLQNVWVKILAQNVCLLFAKCKDFLFVITCGDLEQKHKVEFFGRLILMDCLGLFRWSPVFFLLRF